MKFLGKEYKEFAELYEAARYEEENDRKMFLCGIGKYIDMKFEELEENEIEKYSVEILRAGSGLLINTPDVGTRVKEVLIDAMNVVIDKSEEISEAEDVEILCELYMSVPSAIACFEEGDMENAKELAIAYRKFGELLLPVIKQGFENLNEEQLEQMSYSRSELEQMPELLEVVEYYGIKERKENAEEEIVLSDENFVVNRKNEKIYSIQDRLLSNVKQAKLRFGEVAACSFALEQDLNQELRGEMDEANDR